MNNSNDRNMNRNNNARGRDDQMGAQDAIETDTTASADTRENREKDQDSDRMGRDES